MKMTRELEKFRNAGNRAARNNELRAPFASEIVQEYAEENPEVGSGLGDRMEAWLVGYDQGKSQMLLNDALSQ